MVNKCKVPSCRLANDKVSLFSVPKNEELREKWANILGCELNKSSFVCEKHFDSSDLKDGANIKTNEGVEIFNVS